jgi:dimethylargininase
VSSARGIALVRAPGARLAEGIVTHQQRASVDVDRARQQHRDYVAALAEHGWTPSVVEPAEDCPDAVFIEDAVMIFDDLAVLARAGAEPRREERAGAEAAVRALGLRIGQIDAPGTLDGGDVLQVGPTVYVGRGGRTNAAGIRGLRRLLEPLGRTVVPVRLSGVLHLKSAVTALPDGTLIGLPDRLDPTALPTLRIAPEEPGAHVVLLGGGTVLLAQSAPVTAGWLDDLGFDVVSVDISEFEKLEGCVTCLSVLSPL